MSDDDRMAHIGNAIHDTRVSIKEQVPACLQEVYNQIQEAADRGEYECCPSISGNYEVAKIVCEMLEAKKYEAMPLPPPRDVRTYVLPSLSPGRQQISVSWARKTYPPEQPKPSLWRLAKWLFQ